MSLGSNVGAGLPAMAVGQLMKCCLTHRHRRQASSHILIFSVVDIFGALRSLWEPGLPAMAVGQLMKVPPDTPLS